MLSVLFRILHQQQQHSMKKTCFTNRFGSIQLCSTLFSSLQFSSNFHVSKSIATGSIKNNIQRSLMTTTSPMSTHSTLKFAPKRALVLGKFSRYDFEKQRNPSFSENELIQSVRLFKLS